jgi:hypothetical protein
MHRVTRRFFDLILSNPVPQSKTKPNIVFKGRSRRDTQRAVLRYWAQNESDLGMEFGEFRQHCIWTNDDSIVFAGRTN